VRVAGPHERDRFVLRREHDHEDKRPMTGLEFTMNCPYCGAELQLLFV
jgi:hypothetical protein